MTGGSYSREELEELPEAATVASLGCGNPTALATLSRGRWCWTSGVVGA